MSIVRQEQHTIVLAEHTLVMQRFVADGARDVVFMLHGSIENGRVFYSASGKGLAPYLAQHGFDVFVPDLRGRGASTPHVGRHSSYGQTEIIVEEIPALLQKLHALRPGVPQHFVAHSWGGVLLAAYLARFPQQFPRPRSLVFFGTKRRIAVRHLEKRLKIDLAWTYLIPVVAALWGYLPARRLGFGSDDETRNSFLGIRAWVNAERWTDPVDGFDYGRAAQSTEYPPILSLVGIGDTYLGHPQDVERFLSELLAKDVEHRVLSRSAGNLHDYGHVDILTHPGAPSDHFGLVLSHLTRTTRVEDRGWSVSSERGSRAS